MVDYSSLYGTQQPARTDDRRETGDRLRFGEQVRNLRLSTWAISPKVAGRSENERPAFIFRAEICCTIVTYGPVRSYGKLLLVEPLRARDRPQCSSAHNPIEPSAPAPFRTISFSTRSRRGREPKHPNKET